LNVWGEWQKVIKGKAMVNGKESPDPTGIGDVISFLESDISSDQRF
jgi:hypothetical protein